MLVKKMWTVFIFFSAFADTNSLDFKVGPPYVLLLDFQTGQVLIEKNADKKMAPSSMTKILTAHILFDAIKKKTLLLQEKINISKHAARQGGSRMFLIPGQRVSIDDLLKGIIVVSGNDACTAVSEHISGSEDFFAEKMNKVGKDLGARHSHFVNASGLPHENHYSTCRDLAHLAEKTIRMFPEMYKKYYAIPSFSFNNISQPNRNTLLKSGADGMKTGQTEVGKFGMVASEERHGRRLILVINGCKDARERAREARRLLDVGFTQFQNIVIEQDQYIVSIPVHKRTPIRAIVGQRCALSISRQEGDIQTKAIYKKPLHHPVKKGDVIGTLIISTPKRELARIPLVSESSTKPGGIRRFFHYISQVFH